MDPKIIDLTYCTNVHALGDAAAWSATLEFFGPEVRRHLGWKTMPLGLWWQAALAQEMFASSGSGRETSMADFLRRLGVRAFTCNAFPYGNFHDAVVKARVYVPDWTTRERLEYTQVCARLMASLVPEGGFASISTLPLGWRVGFDLAKQQQAARRLMQWVSFAQALEDETGRHIALALEPEPGCALERTAQVVAFWRDVLEPAASGKNGFSRYLGLCYDTCHQAVQFEEPEWALDTLHAAGIAIHKMQLSSALEFVPDPRRHSLAVRNSFAEPKFLHQTRVEGLEGVTDFDDLPEALASAPWDRTWRTHYHVPLQAESLLDATHVRTTRKDMLRAYRHALKHGRCSHFEVETYTWSVLPESERPHDAAELAGALAREIACVVAETPADVTVRDCGFDP